MIAYVKNLLSKASPILISLLSLLFIILIPITMGLRRKVKKQDIAIGYLTNNLEQYQSLAGNFQNDNRVLQLTARDFKYSNDSLLKQIDKYKKELKIKDKELKSVSSVQTVIRDTLTQTVPVEQKNFEVELKPNDLTSVVVSRKDSILTAILDIQNEQIVYISQKKEWRNKYKNFFQRLFHFDFKKDRVSRYKIQNTNDLIRVTNTRIINIKD